MFARSFSKRARAPPPSPRAHRPRPSISSPVGLVGSTNDFLAAHSFPLPSASATPSSASATPSTPSTSDSDPDPDALAPLSNHLTSYFRPALDPSAPVASAPVDAASPAIPHRQASHTKRAHQSTHRMRSVRRLLSPSPPPSRRRAELGALPDDEHVTGEAEEGVPAADDAADALDPDARAMRSRGLACLAAAEYEAEIGALVEERFREGGFF